MGRVPEPPVDDLRGAARGLSSAAIGDVMDEMGLRHQWLPPQIRPLDEDMIVVGRAMPVLTRDVSPEELPGEEDAEPFGLMLRALDDLKPGEVYLAAGASPAYALWGELMSNRAVRLGAAGAVLHGYARDTREIRDLGFPTFSHGPYARDQRGRGRVVDFRIRVAVGEAAVEPGDVVFGDLEGVCIVPAAAAESVFRLAAEKIGAEDRVRRHILDGGSSAEAFERFGVM